MKCFIDNEPYDVSQFNWNKHKVYLLTDNLNLYVLGELRYAPIKDAKPFSYLNLDKIIKYTYGEYRELVQTTRELNDAEQVVVDEEFNRTKFSRNLLDDMPTYRKFWTNLIKNDNDNLII